MEILYMDYLRIRCFTSKYPVFYQNVSRETFFAANVSRETLADFMCFKCFT